MSTPDKSTKQLEEQLEFIFSHSDRQLEAFCEVAVKRIWKNIETVLFKKESINNNFS